MKARLWAGGLALLFAVVLVWYLVYTQQLVSAVNADAAALSRMYARIFQSLSDPAEEGDAALFDLLEEIERLGIPVVVMDVDGEPYAARNLPFAPDLSDPGDRERVREYIRQLDRHNEPISEEGIGEIHFGLPAVVERLRWVPWIQAATLVVIAVTAVAIFRSTARAEQERIWSTMARESAHQLGTPLSSLSGWVEILRMGSTQREGVATDERIAREIEIDVERLNKVAQRFELIGRRPKLQEVDIGHLLRRLKEYFLLRLPRMDRSIALDMQVSAGLPPVAGNPVLLEWAFENIIKNSVDVLAGRGGCIEISAELTESGDAVVIRFVDDGPGVSPEVRKSVFEPGVTTKRGGWGVGLSLTRRIIEDTHGGSIELGRPRSGAEFVVGLPVMRTGD